MNTTTSNWWKEGIVILVGTENWIKKY